jgi:two-component system chemotaxis response regulator CheY
MKRIHSGYWQRDRTFSRGILDDIARADPRLAIVNVMRRRLPANVPWRIDIMRKPDGKRPMRALLVDDSRPMRQVEAEILQALGFETADACHGKEALSQLQNAPLPDVALVDWKMPEMNGLEFIKAVRSDARLEELVILMVTNETGPDQMARALTAGANEYLTKPFDKAALIDKLRLVGVMN